MNSKPLVQRAAARFVLIGMVAALAVATSWMHSAKASDGKTADAKTSVNTNSAAAAVDLSSSQVAAIKIETLGLKKFPTEKEAIGSIDYVDDRSVQVFPPYQGKLIQTFANLGDNVKKGSPLYTIDSPDLVQAESTLIGAAASLDLTSKELARARALFSTNAGVSERELEQAINDEQTAEGALMAARGAVRIFGKTDLEIDQIVAGRKIDPSLVVPSPISGQVTFFDAPPGMLVQPGTPPAPFTISDISVKWMLAGVVESEAPLFRAGLPVRAKVMAYPGREFEGKISNVYPNVDPGTHRMTVRCEVSDPTNELRPGMLADFVIQVREPVESTAIPFNGVVRNGDGSLSSWVTTDKKHFVRRMVKTGLEHDGYYQVLDGLKPGELAVTDGAIFLSNILDAPPSD